MQKLRPGQIVLSVVAVLALLALTGYTLLQCGAFNSKALLSTAYASDVTLDDLLSATGYVFRDETVITADVPSVSDSAVASGEKVAAGSLVTRLYAAADAEDRQARLSAIDESIAFLTRLGDTDGLKLSDADDLRRLMYNAYLDAMYASGTGNAEQAAAAAREMLVQLSRYDKLIGKATGTDKVLAALRAERKALLDGRETAYYTSEAGYFYDVSAVDGYESVFAAGGLTDRSADEILKLTKASPVSSSNAAGKLVKGINWYLALPVSSGTAETLKKNQRYFLTLRLRDGATMEVPMILEDTKNASDGSAVLLFSCNRMSEELICCRQVEVSLVTGSVSGYRVPNDALNERDGVTGVYILDESTVRFRRVTVLARREGFSVVAARDTSMEDYKEYLNKNDRLILDGKDLYDGKQYG